VLIITRCACRPVLLHSYGVLVLMIEIISSTATFGYAVLLIKYSKSRRTKGLPIPKKGQQPDLDNLKFHVRVLIPCYKESVDLVKLTVLGALKAPLPKDTLRTVYLCDDGKDPAKEEMVRELNNEWGCLEYVSGRKRDPTGESTLLAAADAGRQHPSVQQAPSQQQRLHRHQKARGSLSNDCNCAHGEISHVWKMLARCDQRLEHTSMDGHGLSLIWHAMQ